MLHACRPLRDSRSRGQPPPAIVVAPFRLVIWCWRRDLSTIVRQGYAMTIRQVEDGALADGVNAALPTECCRG